MTDRTEAVRTKGQARPTPLGLSILEHIRRGRVGLLTAPMIVAMRPMAGDSNDLLDVSRPFMDLARARLAYIQAYDPDQPPVPPWVPCLLTSAGEDALMEAAQAARQRKAKKR